jgi:hypothetical protein
MLRPLQKLGNAFRMTQVTDVKRDRTHTEFI